jgi:serine-type D-Ala-D-Ala carboxypeptidase (penicillin-binding protein 5/6)
MCVALAAAPLLGGTVLAGTAQARTTQAGFVQAGTAQAGFVQAGTAQAGTAQAGAAQAATTQAPTAPAGPAGSPVTLPGRPHEVPPGPSQMGPAGAPPPPTVGGPRLAGRGVIVNYPARGGKPLPTVRASAYVIADAGTGQVLAAKDPHGLYRPASTLKVLTAITLMPVLNPDATVVASKQAAAVEPSKVGLIAGEPYRVSDLFKALLMISANDAAIALAQATGSYGKGMAMINAEAHHLQADDTVAVTPNGLDGKGQHVSAYDEALFARQALAVPEFMQDESLRLFRFPLRPHPTPHHRHNMTNLWTQNSMLYTYPGDLGGKIGWTTPAGATFIGWARRGHTTLVVTILHCVPLTELTYAARLLNWGFAMDGKVRPVGRLVSPLPVVTAHHRPARARPAASWHPLAQPKQPALPAVPIAVGLGALLLAVLAGWAIVRVSRRSGRAGSPPGG